MVRQERLAFSDTQTPAAGLPTAHQSQTFDSSPQPKPLWRLQLVGRRRGVGFPGRRRRSRGWLRETRCRNRPRIRLIPIAKQVEPASSDQDEQGDSDGSECSPDPGMRRWLLTMNSRAMYRQRAIGTQRLIGSRDTPLQRLLEAAWFEQWPNDAIDRVLCSGRRRALRELIEPPHCLPNRVGVLTFERRTRDQLVPDALRISIGSVDFRHRELPMSSNKSRSAASPRQNDARTATSDLPRIAAVSQ